MIDFTKSKQYTLSIRLSTDGFSFSIYNPIHNDSLSIIEKEIDTSLSLTANLKAVFHESDFLNHPYKQVNIMMASKRFTIAPLDLFEEEQAELRREYIEAVRMNLKAQLDNIDIKEKDGSVTNLGERYGKKGN